MNDLFLSPISKTVSDTMTAMLTFDNICVIKGLVNNKGIILGILGGDFVGMFILQTKLSTPAS